MAIWPPASKGLADVRPAQDGYQLNMAAFFNKIIQRLD
jgi:hypothetical protein